MKDAIIEIIKGYGGNPDREGLRDTPRRVEKFIREFVGVEPFNPTVFDAEGMDQIVVVSNIPFYSLCEHHLAPFFGVGSIGYIPDGKIIGISKLPRILDYVSRNLQNQERITTEVADYLTDTLNPKGVAVILKARHLCMEMRGIKKPGAETTTMKVTGCFLRNDNNCKDEFLRLVNA